MGQAQSSEPVSGGDGLGLLWGTPGSTRHVGPGTEWGQGGGGLVWLPRLTLRSLGEQVPGLGET